MLAQTVEASGARRVQLEVVHGSVRVERVRIGATVLSPPSPGVLVAGATYDLSPEG
jgi:hypothetical protein